MARHATRAHPRALSAAEVAARKAALDAAKPDGTPNVKSDERPKPELVSDNKAPTRSAKAEKPERKPRISKYAPDYVIEVLLEAPNLPPAKRNGRNPYPLYTTGKTIGEHLKQNATQWNGKPGIVQADFWWDSSDREERKPPQAVIKIHSPKDWEERKKVLKQKSK